MEFTSNCYNVRDNFRLINKPKKLEKMKLARAKERELDIETHLTLVEDPNLYIGQV